MKVCITSKHLKTTGEELDISILPNFQVILALEEDLGFEIPDGDADRMRTPRDIVQYVCDKHDVFH